MPVKRLSNLSGSGLAFVTTSVIDWKPIFKPPAIAREITLQISETMSYYNVSVVGYVVMPSHVHLLLGLNDVSQLSQTVQSFKSLSARRLRNSIGTNALWQRRFDDLIVVSELQYHRKLQYIHNNPVKDGFVEQAIDWEFSSARDWLLNKPGLIEIDKEYK